MRYDYYELKTAEDGKRYITPGKNAKPDVYNPLKEVPNIVLDALNVGMLLMGRKPEAEVEKAVMEFVTRYGLLGLMTALPTTPTFMDYEAVYLPKNHFIKEESMATGQYLSLFYPFDQLDVVKKGIESTWNCLLYTSFQFGFLTLGGGHAFPVTVFQNLLQEFFFAQLRPMGPILDSGQYIDIERVIADIMRRASVSYTHLDPDRR